MDLDWLIVGVIAIVVILWGPAKIPEFAKALGRAKGEFQRAQDEFNNAAREPTVLPKVAVTNVNVSSPPLKSRDEALLGAAKTLGIATEGKTREQISEEISFKVKLLNAD